MKVLVVDIGGTYIKYACMAEDMTILTRGKVPTPTKDRMELIEVIGRIYDKMPDVSGISIAMPGILDTEKGYCVMGGAIRYNDDFYIRQSLYERCPVKICIENDAKCAAMAEASVGSLSDVEDGFVLIFGTMIGGAFIKGHKLHRGKHYSAGEVSYINTVCNGAPTKENVWGNCCGTPRLCKLFAQKKQVDVGSIDGITVFDAVNRGDLDAVAALNEFAREIAVQIFNIQTVLDPERFAIGGGISAQPVFVDYIKRNLETLYAECPYYVPRAEVTVCKFQNDANLIGALQCFLASNRQETEKE